MQNTRRVRRRLDFVLEPLEGRVLLSTAGHQIGGVGARSAHISTAHPTTVSRPSPTRWAWLNDTYWYVPQSNLPAVVFNSGTGSLVPVADQTVYHISGYRNGYFWGETVTQLGSAAPSSSSMIGSVTPQGRVLLHFTSGSNVTEGYGEMTRKGRQWTMENQMFTGSTGGQIGHWAYMVQTRPGSPTWNSLPSVGVSVPTFLSNYSEPVPTPVIGNL